MAGRLQGKTAIVTGAASGQGRAAAFLFAREGARVVLTDISPAISDVAAEIREEGGIAAGVVCDVSRDDQVARLVHTAHSDFGHVDILYNNAGIESRDGTVVDLDVEAWERIQAVNSRGVFLCCKHVLPGMLARGRGAIINISSVGGLVGTAGLDAYTASKGAVIALTRSIAVTYAARGIRANVICPGLTLTPMVERLGKDFIRRTTDLIPMKRAAAPEEIAYAALFLASDESSFVTGAVLPVDGGRTAA